MKNIICLLSIVFTFVCYACYDDEGNYDYHDINEVKITNFPEEMVVKFKDSDTLKIEPVLDGSVMGKREDHYDYTWTAILQGGKGKDLVHFFNEDGLGAIVNSSRGIIAAYKQEKYANYGEEAFADASRAAVEDMVADIRGALEAR